MKHVFAKEKERIGYYLKETLVHTKVHFVMTIIICVTVLILACLAIEYILMLPAKIFKKSLCFLDKLVFNGELRVEEEINNIFDR
jgi:hypothetical protein